MNENKGESCPRCGETGAAAMHGDRAICVSCGWRWRVKITPKPESEEGGEPGFICPYCGESLVWTAKEIEAAAKQASEWQKAFGISPEAEGGGDVSDE